MRGYYRDAMAKFGVNDRGVYDAIFIVSPSIFCGGNNGNTDPSRARKGKGTGAGKGMESLKPGLWPTMPRN